MNYHRIIGKYYLVQTLAQNRTKLDQVAEGCVQSSLEPLQGWTFHQPLWATCSTI